MQADDNPGVQRAVNGQQLVKDEVMLLRAGGEVDLGADLDEVDRAVGVGVPGRRDGVSVTYAKMDLARCRGTEGFKAVKSCGIGRLKEALIGHGWHWSRQKRAGKPGEANYAKPFGKVGQKRSNLGGKQAAIRSGTWMFTSKIEIQLGKECCAADYGKDHSRLSKMNHPSKKAPW